MGLVLGKSIITILFSVVIIIAVSIQRYKIILMSILPFINRVSDGGDEFLAMGEYLLVISIGVVNL